MSQQVYNFGRTSPKFKSEMKAAKAPYCEMHKNTQKTRHSKFIFFFTKCSVSLHQTVCHLSIARTFGQEHRHHSNKHHHSSIVRCLGAPGE